MRNRGSSGHSPAEKRARAFARTIAEARSAIFDGVGGEELDELGSLLETAADRGIETHVAIYGTRTLDGPHTYDMAECGASARLRLSGRCLAVVVADDNDAVVAEFGDRTADQATLTPNPVIVLHAVEYVKADVSGRLMINAIPATAYTELPATPDMQAMLRPAQV